MKTHLLSNLAAVVVVLTLASAAYAQSKPAGDGIAASPKVRQALNERTAATAPVVSAVPAMSCPKCADVRTAKLSPQAKGAEVLTGTRQVTYTHVCGGCETKLTIAGEGKTKHQVASHECAMAPDSMPTCCASK